MPVCDVCGEEEYYEEDGHFFCTVCNTQSQSMVVMELDESHAISHLPRGVLREIGREKKRKGKKSEYESGRPWTRYEAYQLVLQGQAEALIAQGAHQSVKDVILRLYFAYLSKLKVAFVGEASTRLIPKGLENSTHHLWRRELWRGGLDHPEVVPRAMLQKMKRQEYFTPQRKTSQSEEKQSMEGWLEGETFYEGDNPLEGIDEVDNNQQNADCDSLGSNLSDLSFSSDSDTGGGGDDVDGDISKDAVVGAGDLSAGVMCSTPKPKAAKFTKDRVHHSIQYMNLRKTLAFCYLGCLFASPIITVSDILRWVSSAALPYMESTHLLKRDMKLSAYDQHLFRPSPVSSEAIRYDAMRLLHFLGFKEIPEFRVEDITVKYLRALDLPEALVPCVRKVTSHCLVECCQNPLSTYKTLPNVDAVCGAYLLLVVKATFGLDNHRERLLSEYTQQVQSKVGKDIALFDWCAWQRHASCKFLSASGGVGSTSAGQTGTTGTSVEGLCQTFEAAAYKDQMFSHLKIYNRGKRRKAAHFLQENREMLKRSANILEERWKNREAAAARLRAQEQETEPPRAKASSEEMSAFFRNSSLEHIVNAEQFLWSHLGDGDRIGLSSPMRSSGTHSESASLPPSSGASSDSNSDSSLSSVSSNQQATKLRRKRKRRNSVTCNQPGTQASHKRQRRNSHRNLPSKDGSKPNSSANGANVPNTSLDTCKSDVKTWTPCSQKTSIGKIKSDVSALTRSSSSNSETVEELLAMHSQISEDYVSYPRLSMKETRSQDKVQEVRARQHRSYRWLLQLLSQVTCSLQTDIELMLWEIERTMDSCTG